MTTKQTRWIDALPPRPPGGHQCLGWGEGEQNIGMCNSRPIAEPIATSDSTQAIRSLTPALSRRERESHLQISRLVVFCTALLSIITLGCVSAQSAAPLTKDSSIDEILDALDARGKNLKSFVCDVSLTEEDLQTGDAPIRSGKVLYQLKDNGDGRIYVKFRQKAIEAGAKAVEAKLDYLLDDGKLIDRNYSKRAQSTNEILKPGEKLNLLKLGEGPFPLPIGQPKEDVKQMFEVSKIEASKDDPPDTVHIRLIPKPDTRFARQFKVIDTFVDPKQNMPARIVTENPETKRTADLSNVQINPVLTNQDFELEKVDLTGWNISEGAYQDRPFASNGNKK